jgi:hypothetical protein
MRRTDDGRRTSPALVSEEFNPNGQSSPTSAHPIPRLCTHTGRIFFYLLVYLSLINQIYYTVIFFLLMHESFALRNCRREQEKWEPCARTRARPESPGLIIHQVSDHRSAHMLLGHQHQPLWAPDRTTRRHLR